MQFFNCQRRRSESREGERERERESNRRNWHREKKNCMLMGWCLSKRSLKLVDILVVRGKKLQIIHVGPVQAYGNVTFLPQSCTRLDTLANARACEKALPLPSSSNPCNGYSRPRERERERERRPLSQFVTLQNNTASAGRRSARGNIFARGKQPSPLFSSLSTIYNARITDRRFFIGL